MGWIGEMRKIGIIILIYTVALFCGVILIDGGYILCWYREIIGNECTIYSLREDQTDIINSEHLLLGQNSTDLFQTVITFILLLISLAAGALYWAFDKIISKEINEKIREKLDNLDNKVEIIIRKTKTDFQKFTKESQSEVYSEINKFQKNLSKND